MRLSWYIIREHIAPFFFGLSLIVFLFVMNLLFQMLHRIVGKGIPLRTIIEYFALNLAWIIALAVPMSILIATLSAFGRMSTDSEITALRACGISPWRMMKPVLMVAAFVALGIGLFNNFLLPNMNHRTKLLLSDISRKKPTFSIEPGIFTFSIPKYVMRAMEIDSETDLMKDVTIYDEHEYENRSTITAKRGKLKFVAEEEKFLLTLMDGEIHRLSDREPQGYEWTSFDSALFRVDAPGMLLTRQESSYKGDRELSAGEMLTLINKLKSQDSVRNERRISAYWVEIHKKFSIPAACLVFVLLGTPLGMMSHKGGMGAAGGISLLFFTIYWAFLINGEDMANRQLISPVVAMWSPNILFMIIGLWLVRIARHRTTLPAVGWIGAKLKTLFIRK